jgi:hypothetical protein
LGASNDLYTLVGFVFTNASAQFQDSVFWRGIISWFNRLPKIGVLNVTNNSISSINAAYVTLSTTSSLLCNWAIEGVFVTLSGQFTTSTNAAVGSIGVGIDSTSTVIINQFCFINDATHLGNYAMTIPSYGAAEVAHSWLVNGYASLNATASTLSSVNLNGSIMTRG